MIEPLRLFRNFTTSGHTSRSLKNSLMFLKIDIDAYYLCFFVAVRINKTSCTCFLIFLSIAVQ